MIREADDAAGPEHFRDRVLDGLPRHTVDDMEDLSETSAVGLLVGTAGEGLGERVHE
jgi:hypothetical protein